MKKTRIPRRLPTPVPPSSAERVYARFLSVYAKAYIDLMRTGLKDIVPDLKEVAAKELPQVRQDENIENRIRKLFEWVDGQMTIKFSDYLLKSHIRRMIGGVNKNSKKNTAKTVRAAFKNKADVPDFEPLMTDGKLSPYFQNIVDENIGLIRGIPKERETAFKNSLVAMITQDTSQAGIQAAIMKKFNLTKNRAALIARDQVGKLNGALNKYRQEQIGGKRYKWRSSGDARERHDHRLLNNTIQFWSKPPIVNHTTGTRGHPGYDFQCVVGETEIGLVGKTSSAFGREYSGEIVTLTLKSGLKLSATPNHPILTMRGWVPIQSINEFDQVVQCLSREQSLASCTDVNNRMSSAQEIFDLLAIRCLSQRILGSKEQFHKDGSDLEVRVINVDSRLMNDLKARSFQFDKKFVLSFSGLAFKPLTTSGDLQECFDSLGASTTSRVSAASLFDSLLGAHTRPLELFGIRPGSHSDVSKLKSSIDRISTDPVSSSNLFDALSALISVNNISDREIHFIPGFLSPLEVSGVLSKSHKYESSVQVYNFETESGFYSANGIIASNCRCWAEMVLSDILD